MWMNMFYYILCFRVIGMRYAISSKAILITSLTKESDSDIFELF